MAADDDEEMEDGEEPCPVCGKVIWPGAMVFCEHYIWTRWDGELIWEIDEARKLIDAASDFVELVEEAFEHEWLAAVVDVLIENGNVQLASLAQRPLSISSEEVLDHDWLMLGERKETGGMLSGDGSSEFVPRPAAEWTKARTASLQAAIALISKVRPGVH